MSSVIRAAALSAVVSVFVTIGVLSAFQPRRADTPASAQQTFVPGDAREEAVIDAVRTAEPAVVSVIISKDLPVLERYYEEGGPFGLQIPRVRQLGTEARDVGGGTAFFVSDNGLLMTNKHVVADADASYTVLLNDGRRLPAQVIARDPLSDIALLRVDGSGFPALTLASTDEIALGQTAIAIGNALAEFRNTVSVGVISGLQRSIVAGDQASGTERLSRIIQTDAAINAGNSGGPLLSSRGDVIGMNTATAVSAQNISFAIPVSDLRRALKSYAQYGRIVRPYIGVRYVQITPELKDELQVSQDAGALVATGDNGEAAVIPGSPAEKAGLKDKDVILAVDGQKVTLDVPLSDLLSRYLPGETVTLRVARGSEEMDVEMTLEDWKE